MSLADHMPCDHCGELRPRRALKRGQGVWLCWDHAGCNERAKESKRGMVPGSTLGSRRLEQPNPVESDRLAGSADGEPAPDPIKPRRPQGAGDVVMVTVPTHGGGEVEVRLHPDVGLIALHTHDADGDRTIVFFEREQARTLVATLARAIGGGQP